jgi:hypothetical protein
VIFAALARRPAPIDAGGITDGGGAPDLRPLACKTVLSYAGQVGYTWLPGRFAILVDVEPFEVMQVLEGSGRRLPRRTVGPGGIPLVGILGRAAAGRGLVVFVRHEGGLDWVIVGARPMTEAEAAEFEQWRAEQ